MSKSFTQLSTTEVDRRTFQLNKFLGYLDPVHGMIKAQETFITNYASLDSLRNILLFVFYALLADYGDKAATIHDWLYSGYGIAKADGTIYYPTRKEADQVLYRALRAEGVAKWRAWMFYAGVRIGGNAHFSEKQVTWVPLAIVAGDILEVAA